MNDFICDGKIDTCLNCPLPDCERDSAAIAEKPVKKRIRTEYYKEYNETRKRKKDYGRLYYETHRKECLERTRKYYEAHREERKEYFREYGKARKQKKRGEI